MSKRFAEIGPRKGVPESILKLKTALAYCLTYEGWQFRSGGAEGSDEAYKKGAIPSRTTIYTPHDATFEAISLASDYHEYWENCSPWVRKLHGRNAMIILGENLSEPVRFVSCWTPGGRDVGGTGLAIRIAVAHSIPVRNLADPDVEDKARDYVDGLARRDKVADILDDLNSWRCPV
jgi:hypothetical protein